MGITIGVVGGATGLVGEEIIKRIEERKLEFQNIRFFLLQEDQRGGKRYCYMVKNIL